MKFAYDPSHFRDHSTITEMIDATARMGYQYIEWSPRKDFMWFYEYPKADQALIKKTKKTLSDAGIKITSLNPVQNFSSPNEQIRQAAVRNFKRTIQLAVEMDTGTINTEFSGDKSQILLSEDAWIRSMEELAPLIEKEGIQFGIQPHPNDFIERNDEAMRLIRAIDEEWLYLVFSTAHAFYNDEGKGDIEPMFDDAGDKLKHILMADTMNHVNPYGLRYIINPPGANVTIHQHLNIGEGEVDFDTIFRKMKEMNFDGIVTNSVFAYPDKPEWSHQIMLKKLQDGLGIKQ
ncbi:sugar phosphate isomerase/epimerase family protein [Ruoffia tabacinasalis]|uniref:sugar phosphate isomerase/epimerase family protein n=1 Tax=Ruoffia tabacinasalis TaxID=87458 RepID=UPI003F9E384C